MRSPGSGGIERWCRQMLREGGGIGLSAFEDFSRCLVILNLDVLRRPPAEFASRRLGVVDATP
jgi:hypothetical protein